MIPAAVFLALFVGVPLTWAAIRVGRLAGLMDRPGGIKLHNSPTPFTGGASLLATLLVGSLLFNIPAGLIVGAAMTWLLGFVDDVRGLSVRWKLVGLIAPLGVAASTIQLDWNDRLLAIGVGMVLINAFNLVDGLDGLAAGIALPPLLVLSAEPEVGVVAALVLGATVAFLLFNLPRARIFLGDEGSLLLGFLLWALPLQAFAERPEARSFGAFVLLWAFPLANLIFVIASRRLHGRPILVGDRSHLYYVLEGRLGLKVVLTLCWAFAAGGAVLAAMIRPSTG